MSNQTRRLVKLSKVKVPKSHKEDRKEDKTKKGVLVCPECQNYFFKKSWHADFESFLKAMKREFKKVHTSPQLCPACSMIKQHVYEAVVVIEDVPRQFHDEIINLANGFASRAYIRDPQDRIIAIEEGRTRMRITTTENQLGAKLARKIADVFKNRVTLRRSFSREPHEKEHITLRFA